MYRAERADSAAKLHALALATDRTNILLIAKLLAMEAQLVAQGHALCASQQLLNNFVGMPVAGAGDSECVALLQTLIGEFEPQYKAFITVERVQKLNG